MKIEFDKPTEERPHAIAVEGGGSGVQKIWRFDNGYGASVVRFSLNNFMSVGSYGVEEGLWELAVIKLEGKSFTITYDTPITQDVIGHLTEKQVVNILYQIKNLTEVNKT